MRVTVLFLGFIIILSTSLFALESAVQEHAFDAGVEIYNFNFDYRDADIDVGCSGIMYGLAGVYTYHRDPSSRDNLMMQVDGKMAWGQVGYDGDMEADNINDFAWELRAVAGKDVAFSDVTTITPYAGAAYRYLYDALGKEDWGWDRESGIWYSPIGIQTVTDLQNGWAVGLKAEYDIFWSGIQKSYISDIDGMDLDDIENKQNNGYGLRASFEIRKMSETVDFIIEPFIRYWHVEESKEVNVKDGGVVVDEYQEPANDTTEIGIKLMARF